MRGEGEERVNEFTDEKARERKEVFDLAGVFMALLHEYANKDRAVEINAAAGVALGWFASCVCRDADQYEEYLRDQLATINSAAKAMGSICCCRSCLSEMDADAGDAERALVSMRQRIEEIEKTGSVAVGVRKSSMIN